MPTNAVMFAMTADVGSEGCTTLVLRGGAWYVVLREEVSGLVLQLYTCDTSNWRYHEHHCTSGYQSPGYEYRKRAQEVLVTHLT